jgi:hypothetical protein
MSMAHRKKPLARKRVSRSRWSGAGRAPGPELPGPDEDKLGRCTELMRALVQSGHAEDDLLPIADFERVVAEFAAELVKRIPTQYHPDLLQAVENFSRRLMATD